MMRLPIRVLSDLHLGHRASRILSAESLRPLLRGIGTVIFNGDTWEPLAPPWYEASAALLADLRCILKEEGCDALFLRGNHDPEWHGPAHLSLADGRIAITHGDSLLHSSSPWKREILNAPHIIEKIWSEHPDAEKNLDTRLEVARQIALQLPSRHHPDERTLFARVINAAFPPKRALAMLDAWALQGSLGNRFCEAYFPKAEYLIIGHFHRAAIILKSKRKMINTGSFVIPSKALHVDWDGAILTCGKILPDQRSFRVGDKILSSRIS
jgi:UDP-2,3-diacylglucosamine pyrophosphatase LpxH